MKTTLRVLAAGVFLGANVWWFATGANHGWTKTRVPVTTLDEVTGIFGITYEARFVPGLDFLAVAVLATTVLACAPLFFPDKPKPKIKTA